MFFISTLRKIIVYNYKNKQITFFTNRYKGYYCYNLDFKTIAENKLKLNLTAFR